MDDSPMSVHIWMSLYDWVCMRGCGWQVTANPIIDSLQKAISDLVNTCKGLVVVCVNRDVAFHGGRGDLGTIANKVSEICKAAGALVTENDRLWRVVHALTGKNYKIPGSSNLQHFLLKRLLIEKSIDAVAPSNAFVRELEETCINEPDLRFNIPKNMEESKVKFEYKPTFTAQSKRKQEQQDEGHGEQDAFGKADVGDPRLRWYTVTELSKFFCELCAREMQMSKSKVLGPNSKFNPTSCMNCCANWNADTNGIARSIEGEKMYTRLFAECVVAIPDLQNLMVDVNNIQAMITIIRELAYSKLKKELSHVGFVSLTVDQAAQFYNNGRGKQLCASRDVIVCKNSAFLLDPWTEGSVIRDRGCLGLTLFMMSSTSFVGTPSCAEGRFRFLFWPVVWVTFPARCRTIDCSNSLLIFHASFHSGSSCWKYDITSKNPNTISTTSPKDSSFVVCPRSSYIVPWSSTLLI